MKKIYFLSLIMLSFLIVGMIPAGCQKVEDEQEISESEDKVFVESGTSVIFESKGGSFWVSFYSSGNWTADFINEKIDWCTLSQTSGEKGNQSLQIQVKKNETYEERNAGLKIACGNASAQVLITQKQLDAILLSSDRIEIGPEGGPVQLSVQSNLEFQAKVALENTSWIRIISSKALEKHSLELEISPNEQPEKRTGRVILSSGDITEELSIYQEGEEPMFVLDETSFDIAAEGGEIAVHISTNCEFSYIISDESWIWKVQPPQSRSSFTFYFRIAENSSYENRRGIITFINNTTQKRDSVILQQSGQKVLSVEPHDIYVGKQGETVSVKVSSNRDFTCSASVSWMHVLRPENSRDFSNQEILLQIDPNPESQSREGVLKFSSEGEVEEVRVYQSGASRLILEWSVEGDDIVLPTWFGTEIFGFIDWGDGTLDPYSESVEHEYQQACTPKTIKFDMNNINGFDFPSLRRVSSITISAEVPETKPQN